MASTGRRRFLGVLAGSTVALSGCSTLFGDSQEENPARESADVIAGPDHDLRFEPEEITIEVGETVTWYFERGGHNVTTRPQDSEFVQLPDGASPFASFGVDGNPRTSMAEGETYSHTFEVAGDYRYVCGLHHKHEMWGWVYVED